MGCWRPTRGVQGRINWTACLKILQLSDDGAESNALEVRTAFLRCVYQMMLSAVEMEFIVNANSPEMLRYLV